MRLRDQQLLRSTSLTTVKLICSFHLSIRTSFFSGLFAKWFKWVPRLYCHKSKRFDLDHQDCSPYEWVGLVDETRVNLHVCTLAVGSYFQQCLGLPQDTWHCKIAEIWVSNHSWYIFQRQKVFFEQDIPRQTNSSDCGVFLVEVSFLICIPCNLLFCVS